jgi:hypothetical protein
MLAEQIRIRQAQMVSASRMSLGSDVFRSIPSSQ